MAGSPLKVLMITTEWPSTTHPFAAPFVKRQKEKVEQRGIAVEVFHFYGGGNPLNYVKAWWYVRKRLQSNNFDIVHAQWGQSAVPAIPKLKPLVITYRGDDLEGVYRDSGGYGLKSAILKWVGRNVARFADHTILVSKHMLELFRPYSPVDIIPSGIDFSKIPTQSKLELRKELGLPADKRIVIFPNIPKVGRKNFPLVRQSFDRLHEKYPDLYLHIIHGVPHEEILKHIKAADFLFFASFHEGSPNVVKEALACDTPIVSVPVADVPFRLATIPGCFISNDYSVESFVEAGERALSFNYEGFSSRSYVVEIDDDFLTDKLVGIYQNLVEKG